MCVYFGIKSKKVYIFVKRNSTFHHLVDLFIFRIQKLSSSSPYSMYLNYMQYTVNILYEYCGIMILVFFRNSTSRWCTLSGLAH